MKKLALSSLALALCFFSFGQIRYGLKLGVTQSKIDEGIAGSYQDMNYKTGILIGGMAEIDLVKHLDLRAGLQLTQKGFKAVEGNTEGPFYWDRNWSTSYLEIPLDVIFNVPISKTSKFLIGAGTVVSFGLSGKGNAIIKSTDGAGQLHTQESSENNPFKKPGYKRIDLGADFLTGVQYKRILVTASYNYGLMNILNYDQGIQTTKNRCLAFTLGYFLGK